MLYFSKARDIKWLSFVVFNMVPKHVQWIAAVNDWRSDWGSSESSQYKMSQSIHVACVGVESS
jgi:hypothetical protein